MEYLRLGAFNGPPENKKEKAEDGSGLLDRVRSRYRAMYPLTIYHASSKNSRRYTLYADSDALRERWRAELQEGLDIRKIRQESNMVSASVMFERSIVDCSSFQLFAPHIFNETFFKYAALVAPYGLSSQYTGRVNAATELCAIFLNIWCLLHKAHTMAHS